MAQRPGRPAEYSDEQIIAAGERLRAAERRITKWSLVGEIGGGGYDHCFSVWQRHVAERDGPQEAPPPPPEPAKLPPGVAEAADTARGALIAHFDGILLTLVRHTEEDIRTRYNDEFDRLKSDRAVFVQDLAEAEAAVSVLETSLGNSRDEIDALKAQVSELETALAVSGASLRAVTDAAEQDAGRSAAEIAGLKTALLDAQKSQATAVAEAKAADREAERLRVSLSDREAELSGARREVIQLSGEVAVSRTKAEDNLERATRAESELREVRTAAEQSVRNAEREVATANARADAAEARLRLGDGDGIIVPHQKAPALTS